MRTRVHLHITAAVTHSSSIPLIFFSSYYLYTQTQETLFLHGWGLSAPSGSIIPCSNTGGEKKKKEIKKKERKNNFQ